MTKTIMTAAAGCWIALQSSLLAVDVANVDILKPPRVSSEDINVVKVRRVSSPHYQTGNTFHSEGDPFNRDCTRLLFLEIDSARLKAPLPGRGLVRRQGLILG